MKKVFIMLVAIAGLSVANPVYAETSAEESISKGQAHFKIFCANCHGDQADGKGPLVATLEITPSDLTALRQTGGDLCLAERVLKAVAGVHEVAPGQQQNMPTFSGNLEGITIYQITQYLKSVQK